LKEDAKTEICFFCAGLGDIYYRGLYGRKNTAKAIGLYKKACDKNYYMACNSLGAAYIDGEGVKQNYKKAVELYAKACDGNDSSGCSNLGAMYYDGKGVKIDIVKGGAYMRRACDVGDWAGCYNFAFHNYTVGDKQRAKKYYKKACDLGRNTDDVKNIPSNKEIWQKACDMYEILK
jgi:beta-lactamase hcpA